MKAQTSDPTPAQIAAECEKIRAEWTRRSRGLEARAAIDAGPRVVRLLLEQDMEERR